MNHAALKTAQTVSNIATAAIATKDFYLDAGKYARQVWDANNGTARTIAGCVRHTQAVFLAVKMVIIITGMIIDYAALTSDTWLYPSKLATAAIGKLEYSLTLLEINVRYHLPRAIAAYAQDALDAAKATLGNETRWAYQAY